MPKTYIIDKDLLDRFLMLTLLIAEGLESSPFYSVISTNPKVTQWINDLKCLQSTMSKQRVVKLDNCPQCGCKTGEQHHDNCLPSLRGKIAKNEVIRWP